ncbi:MAG: hypothetical protein QM756_43910 [Polyangiaceae bacterium]
MTPTPVCGLQHVVQVASGRGKACARLANGTVKCWDSTSAPQLVPGITNAVDLSVSMETMCVALQDGTLRCSGNCVLGQ